MRILISPAKKMRVDTDSLPWEGMPVFTEKAGILMEWIRGLGFEGKKALWSRSDAIARENAERFAAMDLTRGLTPAILAYDGIQYTYMAPSVMEEGQYAYLQERLRILSGFYGVLRPLDGVTPYRLEMQARAKIPGYRDLYDFWGDSLYREARDESRVLINLASKEYSRCVEPYLQPEDRYVTCVFGSPEGDRILQKGVYAKMARGEMVRFLARIGAQEPEQMRDFRWGGYRFDEQRSSDTRYVFVRREAPGGKPPR